MYRCYITMKKRLVLCGSFFLVKNDGESIFLIGAMNKNDLCKKNAKKLKKFSKKPCEMIDKYQKFFGNPLTKITGGGII